jgi:hypothetical protein
MEEMCKVHCCDGRILDAEAGSTFSRRPTEAMLLCWELEPLDWEADCYLKALEVECFNWFYKGDLGYVYAFTIDLVWTIKQMR